MNWIVIIIAYLFGAINSAVLVCKLLRLPSPRTAGSGNPGTTNVLRIGGKKAAALTLIGDVLKGVIPVVIGQLIGLDAFWLSWVALAAVIGHIFPIYFGFQGGKGVATFIGVMLALNLWLGLAVIVTWLVIAAIFRYSSLAALVAVILSPVYGFFIIDKDVLPAMVILMVLIVFRHSGNIKRLLSGQEPKIGKKKV